ncbi:MAG: hypothetical protein ACFFDT_25575, partial [Candidatus Hodarchaeota archaeon]
EQLDQYCGLTPEEFEDLSLAEQRILRNQYDQQKQWQEWQEENKREKFFNQTQAEHQRLKGIYTDYNEREIERTIMQGRNQFEDAYLSDKQRRIMQGDPETIKSLIPESLMTEIRKEVRTQLIEEARKKEEMRKKLSTVAPDKPGLPKLPQKPAQSWHDVDERVLQRIKEEGISLTI